MKALFVDTAGWMACADAADPAHVACVAARDGALKRGTSLATTDFVVDETLTLLRVRLDLRAAHMWWEQVQGSSRLRWERIDTARFDAAREMFFRHRDKSFSFTDCTSFTVMRELKLTHALTTDHHFQQSGFTMVPSGQKRLRPRPR